MIYLLTAIGLSPGGRSTVHIYTQTIQRTIRNKQYIEQHKNIKWLDVKTTKLCLVSQCPTAIETRFLPPTVNPLPYLCTWAPQWHVQGCR